jgi:hypothetical protein
MLSHALSRLLIGHRANTTKQLVDGVCTTISLLVGFIFIRCSRHQEMEDINHCMFDGVGVMQQLVNLWDETALGLLLSLPPGRSTASSFTRASTRAPKRAFGRPPRTCSFTRMTVTGHKSRDPRSKASARGIINKQNQRQESLVIKMRKKK